MGGLASRLPATCWTFTVGALALCGVPPLSGFYSKDGILAAAESRPLLFGLAVVVAALTAFYMTRLVFVALRGPARDSGVNHAHESPAVMVWPLRILAIASVLAGFWGVDAVLRSALGGLAPAAWAGGGRIAGADARSRSGTRRWRRSSGCSRPGSVSRRGGPSTAGLRPTIRCRRSWDGSPAGCGTGSISTSSTPWGSGSRTMPSPRWPIGWTAGWSAACWSGARRARWIWRGGFCGWRRPGICRRTPFAAMAGLAVVLWAMLF